MSWNKLLVNVVKKILLQQHVCWVPHPKHLKFQWVVGGSTTRLTLVKEAAELPFKSPTWGETLSAYAGGASSCEMRKDEEGEQQTIPAGQNHHLSPKEAGIESMYKACIATSFRFLLFQSPRSWVILPLSVIVQFTKSKRMQFHSQISGLGRSDVPGWEATWRVCQWSVIVFFMFGCKSVKCEGQSSITRYLLSKLSVSNYTPEKLRVQTIKTSKILHKHFICSFKRLEFFQDLVRFANITSAGDPICHRSWSRPGLRSFNPSIHRDCGASQGRPGSFFMGWGKEAEKRSKTEAEKNETKGSSRESRVPTSTSVFEIGSGKSLRHPGDWYISLPLKSGSATIIHRESQKSAISFPRFPQLFPYCWWKKSCTWNIQTLINWYRISSINSSRTSSPQSFLGTFEPPDPLRVAMAWATSSAEL